MDANKIEKLKAAAYAATPGPWDLEDGEVGHDVAPFVFVHKPGPDGTPDDGMRIKVEKHHMYPARRPIVGGPAWNNLAECALLNAQFVALANPAAVLELIAEVERLRARFDYIEDHATTSGGGHGFEVKFFVPVDHEDICGGIDAAIEEQTKAGKANA